MVTHLLEQVLDLSDCLAVTILLVHVNVFSRIDPLKKADVIK